MPKRKFSEVGTSQGKNSLDSDEDDNDSGGEQYELKDEDIEGQEDGVVGHEEGIQITPFNMNEELEEGHFDKEGMYHWKKEKLAKDNWLENIDWIKVKESKQTKKETTDIEMPLTLDVNELYEKILKHMQPKETISKTLKRLGQSKSLSASQRLKLKKAGITADTKANEEDLKTFNDITEWANQILTYAGNMDIYDETYEQIQAKLAALKKSEPELDMYADDFESKEKEKMDGGQKDDKPPVEEKSVELLWEYKEKEDSQEIKGPYTSQQMEKYSQNGLFNTGVLVRKFGTQQFYTSNRIDFDLYI